MSKAYEPLLELVDKEEWKKKFIKKRTKFGRSENHGFGYMDWLCDVLDEHPTLLEETERKGSLDSFYNYMRLASRMIYYPDPDPDDPDADWVGDDFVAVLFACLPEEYQHLKLVIKNVNILYLLIFIEFLITYHLYWFLRRNQYWIVAGL